MKGLAKVQDGVLSTQKEERKIHLVSTKSVQYFVKSVANTYCNLSPTVAAFRETSLQAFR